MKANVPEKIYISPNVFNIGEHVTKSLTTKYRDNIEYIRTDGFIEKACEYLRTHLWQNIDDDNDPIIESVHNITLDNFIKDFKRYLEE